MQLPEIFFLISCCTCGVFPICLRTWSPAMGGALAEMMRGVCGKALACCFFSVLIVCNFLGWLWLYLASLSRTDANSSEEGDPNYCPPAVWNTAYFIVNAFWCVLLFVFLRVGAKVYMFFRGDDDQDLRGVEEGRRERG